MASVLSKKDRADIELSGAALARLLVKDKRERFGITGLLPKTSKAAGNGQGPVRIGRGRFVLAVVAGRKALGNEMDRLRSEGFRNLKVYESEGLLCITRKVNGVYGIFLSEREVMALKAECGRIKAKRSPCAAL